LGRDKAKGNSVHAANLARSSEIASRTRARLAIDLYNRRFALFMEVRRMVSEATGLGRMKDYGVPNEVLAQGRYRFGSEMRRLMTRLETHVPRSASFTVPFWNCDFLSPPLPVSRSPSSAISMSSTREVDKFQIPLWDFDFLSPPCAARSPSAAIEQSPKMELGRSWPSKTADNDEAVLPALAVITVHFRNHFWGLRRLAMGFPRYRESDIGLTTARTLPSR
jgi:hypothetical protein